MVRFKHRYLLVHLVFPAQLDTTPFPSSQSDQAVRPSPILNESAIINLLRDSLSVNFGDVGAGEVGGTFSIKYLSPSTSTLIIRVSREHYRTLWAALTLLRRIGGQEVVARVIHVSGTIRKTQHAAIAHDRSQILLSAKRSRMLRRPRPPVAVALSSPPVAPVVPAPTAEEARELDEKLKKSEEEIMGMEA
ncbi:hypothetical protein JCM6882_002142 [Rhodosporidiobolus microsporus]